jgi:hypothetical protein
MDNKLMGEMEIIDCVASYLKNEKHYTIARRVGKTSDRGADMVVVSPKNQVRLSIEAKGQTSSDSRTNRFGQEFDISQKEVHLGKALLKSCQYLEKNEMAGIALPDDTVHRDLVLSISVAIRRLGIIVFLVNEKQAVRVMGDLPA